MTFSRSWLSANTCISSTCCTIVCKHQILSQCNKKPPSSLNKIHHALFSFLTNVKLKKEMRKERMKICNYCSEVEQSGFSNTHGTAFG